jgi:hypothetical protein
MLYFINLNIVLQRIYLFYFSTINHVFHINLNRTQLIQIVEINIFQS